MRQDELPLFHAEIIREGHSGEGETKRRAGPENPDLLQKPASLRRHRSRRRARAPPGERLGQPSSAPAGNVEHHIAQKQQGMGAEPNGAEPGQAWTVQALSTYWI